VSQSWMRPVLLTVAVLLMLAVIYSIWLMPGQNYHVFALSASSAALTAIVGVWQPIYVQKRLVWRLAGLTVTTAIATLAMTVLVMSWPSVSVYQRGRVDSASPAICVVLLSPIAFAVHLPQTLFPAEKQLPDGRLQ